MNEAPRAASRGFTLLEIMAALIIFLAGVVGVLALFASALAMHRDATRQAVVAQAADEVRTEIDRILIDLAEGDADLESLPPLQAVPLASHPGYFYSAQLTPDPELGLDGGILAQVHVFTRDVGKEKGETFTLFRRPRADPELLIRRARRGPAPAAAQTGAEER